MASVVLVVALALSVRFPARAQDVRPHQEYVDKGYCTYTYVVPPGSRTGSFSPLRLEEQLAETKEKTARLENQVDLLISLVETLLSQQSDLTSRVDNLSAELSEEKVRSAQLEQNLTQELQEQEARLQSQCCERLVPGDVISTTAAALPSEPVSAVAPRTKTSESTAFGISISSTATELGHGTDGGWTVIQRRQDGTVSFDRTWEEYKLGFGNKNGDFWFGNENIHLLTNQKNYRLRIELLDWNNGTRHAEYSTFRVSGESDGYRLYIAGYSGTAGDSMAENNGMQFSTVDRDNDAWGGQCSELHGGWWQRFCYESSINGHYLGNCGSSCAFREGVVWKHWKGSSYSLKYVSMKIRP